MLDQDKTESFVRDAWSWEKNRESVIFDALKEYIAIPNASPDFDPKWSENGHTDKAAELLVKSVSELKYRWGKQGVKTDDITVEILGSRQFPEFDKNRQRRSPLICINIPAFGADAPEGSVLLYGHIDKQPETLPWAEGLGPRTPVLKDNRLYGRGGADDGYAVFSAFTAVMALRAQNAGHAHCVIIAEACEESGSKDLLYYIRKLENRIGDVSLIVCLDSGSGNYDQLWITTSLRGLINFWLEVRVLNEGVHSGKASGIAPGSYRITGQLISRIENITTGEITPSYLKVEIPVEIRKQARKTADIMGKQVYSNLPFANDNVQAADTDITELLLNNTWRAQLSVTGIQGLPVSHESAGNVLLPYTRVKLSLRLPPVMNAETTAKAVIKELTDNPPYNAVVSVSEVDPNNGWATPALAPWLEKAFNDASIRFFRTKLSDKSKEAMYIGEGGSIPFMGLLGEMFPDAQFMITGVLGPNSNAHVPNEFLDLPYAQKVTMCVAQVISAHYEAKRGEYGKST
ncbi:MAG: M20/M25/M40 family metallo-hydrolase [Deferribacteraceae bacterium]|jgi:acetylornithine deacetylase/succinyl-diaminopimelate desuccinylase-like protein|nr:M20/M25/M40 family metallo-hydrolase [Deferribacteraceae bacterium]